MHKKQLQKRGNYKGLGSQGGFSPSPFESSHHSQVEEMRDRRNAVLAMLLGTTITAVVVLVGIALWLSHQASRSSPETKSAAPGLANFI